jgi:hypothetical protein
MANPAVQSIGILFNAAGIAAGVTKPPFRTKLQGKNSNLQVFDILTVDATLSETHSAQAEVTEHPVEVGSDVTDHIRPKPVEVRIDGVVTNSPLPKDLLRSAISASPIGPGLAIGEAAALAIIGAAEFTKDAFNTLRKIRDNGQLVVLATPYQQYENMAMTELQVVRATDTGDALHFQATFRQIVTVDAAKTVTLPPIAQDSFDLGTQSTTNGSASVVKDNKTVLERWFGSDLNSVLPQDPNRPQAILKLPVRN